MLKYFEKVALQKQKIRKYRFSAGRNGGGEDGSALVRVVGFINLRLRSDIEELAWFMIVLNIV